MTNLWDGFLAGLFLIIGTNSILALIRLTIRSQKTRCWLFGHRWDVSKNLIWCRSCGKEPDPPPDVEPPAAPSRGPYR